MLQLNSTQNFFTQNTQKYNIYSMKYNAAKLGADTSCRIRFSDCIIISKKKQGAVETFGNDDKACLYLQK